MSLRDLMRSLKMFNLTTTFDHATKIMAIFDENEDGTIEFDEWLQVMRFRQLFDKFDR